VPFDLVIKRNKSGRKESSAEYLIEPSPEEILNELLKSFLEQKIRGSLISSKQLNILPA
jgi:F0F1-type ATP synthase gamma subunit